MVALSVEYVQMNLAVSKKGCAVLKPVFGLIQREISHYGGSTLEE